MNDTTILLQRMKAEAERAKGNSEPSIRVGTCLALELVEALEKAQQRNGELETYSKTALEFREAALTELNRKKSELAAVEAHAAELEAREVALPKHLSPEGYHIDEAYMVDDAEGEYLDRDEVIEAIRAAGIGVKGE